MKNQEGDTRISSAEVARLAQVRPATVSNWRRRHPDFPKPVGGTASRALFSHDEVVAWLDERGQLSKGADDVKEGVRAAATDANYPELSLALNVYSRLADDAAATRLGLPPLPADLKPDKITRVNCVSKYEAVRDYLASYPDPYPETGQILAKNPHVTVIFAPATWLGTDIMVEGDPKVGSPSWLVDLVLELAPLEGYERVLDLAAGLANFLRSVAWKHPAVAVRGFESNPVTASKAAKFAVADGVKLDLTTIDAFSPDTAESVGADVVFADGVWGEPLDLNRLIGDSRFPEPLAVRQRDWAWVHLAIHHLSGTGRGFVTLPATALQHGNAKGWRNLVLQGCIEAVIALPAGLYSSSHQSFQTCLLVVRKAQPDGANSVLMMSAEKSLLGRPDRAKSQLVTAYRAWRSGVASRPTAGVAVPVTTLAQSKSTLVPRRWLFPTPDDLSLEELAEPTDTARKELTRLFQDLPKPTALGRLRVEAVDAGHVSLNDLIQGHRIQVLTSLPPNTSHTDFEEHTDLIPVVTAQSLTGLDPDDSPIRSYSYVSDEERAKIGDDNLMTRPGDIIVSPVAHNGRVVARAVTDTDPVGFVSRTETHLRPVTDDLDPEYLALMLQSKWNGIFFTGESPARFNVRDLEIQPVPLAQQRATVEGLKALHQARLDIELLAGALDQLKNAAIDAAATGRYTVSGGYTRRRHHGTA